MTWFLFLVEFATVFVRSYLNLTYYSAVALFLLAILNVNLFVTVFVTVLVFLLG